MTALRGKVILITGGGSGIGRATAETLAAAGAAVAITGRRAAPLDEAAHAIEAAGGRALPLPGDAADEADVAAAVEAAVRWGSRLDAAVANAALGLVGGVEGFAPADWHRMMAVNLGGPFLLARAAVPHLRAPGGHVSGHVSGHIGGQPGGAFIAVGSELSRGAMGGLSGYVASKWGLLGFMRSLSLEWRHEGIRVGTVLPGATLTDFGPDDAGGKAARRNRGERFLQPAEVAEAIAFMLTRPAGAWVPELDMQPS